MPAVARTVAVLGASSAPHKFGNKAVRAYLRQGWTVYPVNPNEPTVEGLPTYPSLSAIPVAVDRVSLYVPPAIGVNMLEEIQSKQASAELWLNPGAESDELLEKAERLGLAPIQACSIVEIGERP